MGELIDDLLTFSRLSRQPLSKQEVQIDQLVRTTLSEMKVSSEFPKAQIDVGALPPSKGDPALLKQVWVNLLSNALKYSRKRQQPVVEIGCIEKDGERVYFVRDNGSGFDMRYADKLFGVFQRLHRSEDFEGNGRRTGDRPPDHPSSWREGYGLMPPWIAERRFISPWPKATNYERIQCRRASHRRGQSS